MPFIMTSLWYNQGCLWHCIWHDKCRLSWQAFAFYQGCFWHCIWHDKCRLIFIGATLKLSVSVVLISIIQLHTFQQHYSKVKQTNKITQAGIAHWIKFVSACKHCTIRTEVIDCQSRNAITTTFEWEKANSTQNVSRLGSKNSPWNYIWSD